MGGCDGLGRSLFGAFFGIDGQHLGLVEKSHPVGWDLLPAKDLWSLRAAKTFTGRNSMKIYARPAYCAARINRCLSPSVCPR